MLISQLGSPHSGTLGLKDSLIGGKEGMVLNPFTEKVRGAEGEVRASPTFSPPFLQPNPLQIPSKQAAEREALCCPAANTENATASLQGLYFPFGRARPKNEICFFPLYLLYWAHTAQLL